MKVTVKVPGTCGELVQGLLDETNFLISCPIDLYNAVTVKVDDSQSGIKMAQQADKTLLAIKKTLQYFGYQNLGLEVELESQLLVGKGMASSTADIVAAIIATTLVLGEEVELELVTRLALAIEPTDASFWPGIVVFDHLEGSKVTSLGQIEPISLLVFDYGGEVDTIAFNQRDDLIELKRAKSDQIARAYQLVKEGVQQNDWELIGQGATISSLANQDILLKPNLEQLIDLVERDEGLLGVNIAHSGTLVGVLIKEGFKVEPLLSKITKEIPKLNYLMCRRIINGGYLEYSQLKVNIGR
ncbi:kinase [Natroniella acetigena]|uniref:GHMP family kinase ATP-binding protein n=1 Tax=Natroniella acetigena TaxID=52004 RepID=UPI00200AFD12|nr:kinase [Natroniella acetigena]MCK8826484.1 kinase [Natroniella acetigena]